MAQRLDHFEGFCRASSGRGGVGLFSPQPGFGPASEGAGYKAGCSHEWLTPHGRTPQPLQKFSLYSEVADWEDARPMARVE